MSVIIELELSDADFQRLDAWRTSQIGELSPEQAIRRIIASHIELDDAAVALARQSVGSEVFEALDAAISGLTAPENDYFGARQVPRGWSKTLIAEMRDQIRDLPPEIHQRVEAAMLVGPEALHDLLIENEDVRHAVADLPCMKRAAEEEEAKRKVLDREMLKARGHDDCIAFLKKHPYMIERHGLTLTEDERSEIFGDGPQPTPFRNRTIE